MKSLIKNASLFSLVSLAYFCANSAAAQSFQDTLFERQWGIKNDGQSLYRSTGELTQEEIKGTIGIDINAVDVSKIEGLTIDKNRKVVVAVLDTGLDINHPELKDRIYVDRTLCPNEEDLGKKPCSGMNILNSNAVLTDDDGHGTHVAGIIAANSNAQGVAGVTDSRVKILPVKVLNDEINHFVYNRKLVTDWFADGIAYAIARGADVINMSIGWPAIIHTPKMKAVLKAAAEKNIAIVVAAGNNNKEIPTYPCTEEEVICVGAYDNQGKISEFSNFGGKVDISAPGESIVSLYPMDTVESRVLRIKGYEVKNGTSQAAPFVSAIAASLKLAYPEITYDELKARLYSSALSEVPTSENKFTQFGRVNMKGALTERPNTFIAANFKNLLEVNYSIKTGSFTFPIEIKSFVSDELGAEVKVKFENSDIELKDSSLKVDLYKGITQKILVEGSLNNLQADTNQMFSVEIKVGDKVFVNKSKVVFSRDLSFESDLVSEKVTGVPYSDLLYFSGSNKATRVKRIKTNYGNSPEYFTMKASLQGEDKSAISVLKRVTDGTWKLEDIAFRKFHSIIKVYKNDFDLDGIEDYLIYGVLPGEEKLGYSYILNDGIVDFNFALLNYKAFPISADDLSEVQFINTDFRGRTLKVPSFYANYRLPEQDNTDDILERVNEEATANLLYYMDPQAQGELELRVLNGPRQLDALKDKLNIAPWDSLIMEKPFNVSTKSQQKGNVTGLLSSGEEFSRTYFKYNFIHTDKDPEVEMISIPYAFVSQNSSLLVWDINNVGAVSTTTNLVVQPSREMARSVMLDAQEESFVEFSTHNYRDPVFGVIGSFNDDEKSHLLEGRYFVHYRNHKGEESRLRINRESSFPGVQFAETLAPVVVKVEGENRPGAFINSTLIFGSRLYTMVADKQGKLTRPAGLSVEIPSSCVHLTPEAIEGSYQYLLLCRERDNSVAFKMMPLVLGE